MPTPRGGYKLKDGTRVPSVTTVTGRFKDSAGLLHWAWNEGREGRDLHETRDKAASVGTAAHAMVYANIKGTDPMVCEELTGLTPEGQEKAVNAFGMYCEWATQSRLEIVEQEMQLVSEVHRYGGTPDAVGRVNGQLCLIDWKTSNDVYVEYLIQIAAYKILWEETHPDQPLTGGYHLCRFSKDFGDFSHHYYRELTVAEEQFILLRKCYENDKLLKRR